MASVFSCDPDCTIGDFGAIEWLIIVVALISIISIATLLTKWAFDWNKIPESTLLWHVPRFLLISFVILITTVPSVSYIFGRDIGYVYGKVIAPVVCIVVYIVWLAISEVKMNR